jgi:hypothetical protein
MDPRERINDPQEVIRMALDARQAKMWTAFPGILQSYDATKMTCRVQPAVMGRTQNRSTGEWTNVNMPLLVDCPVFYLSGGGFTVTFPLKADDEVLVVVANRCIDGWWQNGGQQPQLEFRMHDLSDGFVFPKCFSQPKILNPAPDTTNMQIRSDDGSLYMEFTPDGKCNMVVPGGTKVTTPTLEVDASTGVTFNTPYLHVSGAVIAGYGGADQVGVQTHVHAQPPDSAGNSQQPTNAPTPGT